MRRPEGGDLSPILKRFESGEVLLPVDEVVYLLQVDAPAEVIERPGDLLAPLARTPRPHLRRDQGLAQTPFQRRAAARPRAAAALH